MRKLVLLTALLHLAALVPGAPAQAAMGRECVKLGAPSVCMVTVIECNRNVGGLCLAPCSYQPPKVVKRHAPKKKVMVKKPAPAPKEKNVGWRFVSRDKAPSRGRSLCFLAVAMAICRG